MKESSVIFGESIKNSALDRQYVVYGLISAFPTFDSRMFGNYLKEEATYSTPLEEVKTEILFKYQLDDWQFRIVEHNHKIFIALIIADVDINAEAVEDDMKFFGYFKSTDEYAKDKKGRQWRKMQFEPMFQNNEDNLVRSLRWLFHITPERILESIRENGLVPQNRNKRFKFPNRVYFIRPDIDVKKLKEIGESLMSTSLDVDTNENYYILTIDLSKVPTTVDFFLDPNFKYGVFTTGEIPKESICSISKLTY